MERFQLSECLEQFQHLRFHQMIMQTSNKDLVGAILHGAANDAELADIQIWDVLRTRSWFHGRIEVVGSLDFDLAFPMHVDAIEFETRPGHFMRSEFQEAESAFMIDVGGHDGILRVSEGLDQRFLDGVSEEVGEFLFADVGWQMANVQAPGMPGVMRRSAVAACIGTAALGMRLLIELGFAPVALSASVVSSSPLAVVIVR
mmetsp:Transcript_16383/g.45694  ORF Transcript_16383/g.45694 Transcript_16383/m.45694 type:complete len:202 (-) Transcript_16383:316-921(-)